MNFQTILSSKGIMANFCHKKFIHLDHSYLKYALETFIHNFNGIDHEIQADGENSGIVYKQIDNNID